MSVKPGEVHAIMGPNGSGKSTLASAIVGHPAFEVTSGSVTFEGRNLLEKDPEERANEGIFLSFQYPVEIPGVSMVNFMRTAINEQRKYRNCRPCLLPIFYVLCVRKSFVDMDNKLTNRSVNEGFSGGEKKKTRFFRWRCWSPNWQFWMRPIQAWI